LAIIVRKYKEICVKKEQRKLYGANVDDIGIRGRGEVVKQGDTRLRGRSGWERGDRRI